MATTPISISVTVGFYWISSEVIDYKLKREKRLLTLTYDSSSAEFIYEDVFLVWETIWAARHVASSHFVLFIAVALVQYYREIILANSMDSTDIIKFFNGNLVKLKLISVFYPVFQFDFTILFILIHSYKFFIHFSVL